LKHPNLNQLSGLANMGLSTSLYQLSAGNFDLGLSANQWDMAALAKTVPPVSGTQSVWQTLEDYLPLLSAMGIRHLRLSVEWHYIEPRCGFYNPKAMMRYQKLLKKCIHYQIEPMLTLYHFTQPQWFVEKGGFEKGENIPFFVNYVKQVVTHLSPWVKRWCTINEPAVEAFSGYMYGQFPPHQRLQFTKAALVLKHLLIAHMQAYEAVFNLLNKENLFGIVHNMLRFESRSAFIRKVLTEPLTRFTDELVMGFLADGHFDYRGIHYHDDRPRGNCSFMNIYGDVQIGYFGPTCQKHQLMGDMYIALYPESYAKALERASMLNLPLYITETGIADASDTLRQEYILQFLQEVIHAVAKGQDIRGVYFWTFKDNYEWNEGYRKCFGFFDSNNEARESARMLASIISRFQAVMHKEQAPELIITKWLDILKR
jgi:beta-glucosidase